MKPEQNETSGAQEARKPYVPLKLVVHGHFRDIVRGQSNPIGSAVDFIPSSD